MSNEVLTTDDQTVHTPGPWKLDWAYAGGGTHKDYPELHYVNISSSDPWGNPKGLSITGYMRQADARLMVMAPELLAAAKAALHEMCHTAAPRNSFTDAVDLLDAAIAKAEGQS